MKIKENFTIMKNEFKVKSVYLSRDNRIIDAWGNRCEKGEVRQRV